MNPEKDESSKEVNTLSEKTLRNVGLVLVGIVALIVVVFLAQYLFSLEKENQDNSHNVVSGEITYPDYMANPNAYVVDDENLFSDFYIEDTPLWVEEVVTPDTLRVSFVIEKISGKVIHSTNINIPGLKFITNSCMEREAVSFMKDLFEKTNVFLVNVDGAEGLPAYVKGWMLVRESSTQNGTEDVAALLVAAGYGVAASGLDDYEYEHPLENTLREEQKVAQLAQKGMWGRCQ